MTVKSREEFEEVVASVKAGKRVIMVGGRSASSLEELQFALEAEDAAQILTLDGELVADAIEIVIAAAQPEAKEPEMHEVFEALKADYEALVIELTTLEGEHTTLKADFEQCSATSVDAITKYNALLAEQDAAKAEIAQLTEMNSRLKDEAQHLSAINAQLMSGSPSVVPEAETPQEADSKPPKPSKPAAS